MSTVVRTAGGMGVPALRPLLAWTVVVLTVVITVVNLVVAANVAGGAGVVASLPENTLALPFVFMGALIVWRRPHNRIGWTFVVIGGLAAMAAFLSSYALASVWFAEAVWPGTVWATWLGSWLIEVAAALLVVFLPLTFPTGRLLSPAWRPFAWLSGLTTALFVISGVVTADTLTVGAGLIDGGVSVGASPTQIVGADAVISVVNLGASVAFLCVIVTAMWSLRLRYRRASGIERLQIKWLLYAVLFMIAAIAILIATPRAIPISEFLFDTVFAIAVWAFPVAVGGAVLRYRLFDIDRLISRTVSYALLTAVLAGVYAAGALISQRIFASAAGNSSMAVAIVTLTVAALFAPLRRRLQAMVDRHFNRSRYDAVAMMEAFRTRVQAEVDLTTLAADLYSVIAETMKPAHAGVWVRHPKGR